MRKAKGLYQPWLPLTRELAAKPTEGEKKLSIIRLFLFCSANKVSPSVKTYGFATSLVRGRQWYGVKSKPPLRGRRGYGIRWPSPSVPKRLFPHAGRLQKSSEVEQLPVAGVQRYGRPGVAMKAKILAKQEKYI